MFYLGPVLRNLKLVNKLLCIIIILSMILCVGCTDFNNSANSNPIAVNSNRSEDYFCSLSKFNDGVAWVLFCDANAKGNSKEALDRKYGCIDKAGNVVFYIDADDIQGDPTDFSNGYSYIRSHEGKQLSVIDTSGNICSTFNLVTESYNGSYYTKSGNFADYCVLYEDGYEVVQQHDESFDSNYYLYTIYDGQGDELYFFKSNNKDELKVEYLGQGVINFSNTGVFFAKNNLWVDAEDIEYRILDLSVEYGDRIDTASYDEWVNLKGIDSYGNTIETKTMSRSELGWNICNTDVCNDRCLIYGYPDDGVMKKMYIYNFNDDSIVQLTDEKYLNNIDEDFSCFYMDDRIVITMTGQDKKQYFGVFDYEWNVVSEPQTYNRIGVDDNRIVVNRKDVYDENGNLLFSLDDKYCGEFEDQYSDDVFVVQAETDKRFNGMFLGCIEFAAFDLDGNVLFDNINTEHMVQLEI